LTHVVDTVALRAKFAELNMPGAGDLVRRLESLRDLGIEPNVIPSDDVVPPQFWDKRILTPADMDAMESDMRSVRIGRDDGSVTPLEWLEQVAFHAKEIRAQEPGGLAMYDQILGGLAEDPNLGIPLIEDATHELGTEEHEKDLLFGGC